LGNTADMKQDAIALLKADHKKVKEFDENELVELGQRLPKLKAQLQEVPVKA
jgi:hypothetical protein